MMNDCLVVLSSSFWLVSICFAWCKAPRIVLLQLQPSMLDFFLMLWVKLPVAETIYPQSNKFATAVENNTTGDWKLHDNPVY